MEYIQGFRKNNLILWKIRQKITLKINTPWIIAIIAPEKKFLNFWKKID